MSPPAPHGHSPPPPGEPQPGTGARTNTADFVNVQGRLFAPLQGLASNDVLQGGYGWLDVTDGGDTLHPGADLNSGGSCNADEGLLVVAPLAGVVRATLFWDGYSSGEGNHVWVELDDPCLPGVTWWHTDHLFDIACAVGQRLAPGDPIGLCGRSGNWDCAHAHTELLKSAPQYGWFQWPYNWSRAQVEAAYWPPAAWWSAATALVLAEGNQPIPPEVVAMLSDWEVLNWVMPELWAWAKVDYNPEALTSKAWLAELRAGRYRGRPRTTDREYGDPVRGAWAEYDAGVVVTRSDSGEWSWQG